MKTDHCIGLHYCFHEAELSESVILNLAKAVSESLRCLNCVFEFSLSCCWISEMFKFYLNSMYVGIQSDCLYSYMTPKATPFRYDHRFYCNLVLIYKNTSITNLCLTMKRISGTDKLMGEEWFALDSFYNGIFLYLQLKSGIQPLLF